MPVHRVHRETVELRVLGEGAEALARSLQDRISVVHRRKLSAILDRVCSEVSPDDRVHRLARLELELGTLDLDDFEADLCRRFELALRRALGPAIAAREADRSEPGPSPTASAFELLEHFARHGTLPWWADARRPTLVAEALAKLVDADDRGALARRLLSSLAGHPEGLARVVRAGDEADLRRLLERASGPTVLRALDLALARVASIGASGQAPSATRERIWLRALAHVGATADPSQAAAAILLDADALAPKPDARAPEVDGAPPGADAELIELLLAAVDAAPEDRRALLRSLLGFAAIPLASTEVGPAPADGPSEEAPDSADVPGPDGPSDQGPALAARIRRLALALLAGSAPAATVREQLRWLSSASAAALPEPLRAELIAALEQLELRRGLTEPRDRPEAPASPADTSRARVDGLAIDNAGLVILWPFLERLFQRCALVDAQTRAFVDEHARARAVHALQYLADDDGLDPPEFLLPLNKVLCGLEPESALAAGALEPLDAELRAECDRMLQAVITHAEILHDMSTTDLRHSFLRREGVLASRDGAWLLQVERAAHDLVLDRFPWTWGWLSLPWMATPLRVEW